MRAYSEVLTADRISLLKQNIIATFGRDIKTNGDCVDLSLDIYSETSQTLNTNTLRRFFGLVPYNSLPSKSTLNILSLYCGYQSFHDLQQGKSSAGKADFKDRIAEILSEMFLNGASKNEVMLKKAFSFIESDHDLKNKFQGRLSTILQAQPVSFEKNACLDELNKFYGECLQNSLVHIKDKEERVLATSVLVYRHWLAGNIKELNYYAQYIANTDVTALRRPSVAAWLFCARLFYFDNDFKSKALIQEIYSYYFKTEITPASNPQHCFEFLVGQALVLTGHLKEGLLFLTRAEEYIEKGSYTDVSFLQSVNLWKAFGLFRLGDVEKADAYCKLINPAEFDHLSFNYSHLVFYIIQSGLENSYTENFIKIDNLIKELGFVKMQSFSQDTFQKLNNN